MSWGGWKDRGGAGRCGSWKVLGGGPGGVLEGMVLGRIHGRNPEEFYRVVLG